MTHLVGLREVWELAIRGGNLVHVLELEVGLDVAVPGLPERLHVHHVHRPLPHHRPHRLHISRPTTFVPQLGRFVIEV